MKDSLERLIYDISLRMRLLKAIDEETSKSEFLSEREILILELLSERGRMTVSDIADAYPGAKTSAVSIFLKKLEKARGLISKTRSTEDERVVMVELSPEGESELERIKSRRAGRFSILLKAIDVNEDEQKVFENVLKRAIGYMDLRLKFKTEN